MCGVASDPLGVVDAGEVDGMEVGVRKVDGMDVGVRKVDARKVAEMVCEVEVESDSQKIRNVQQG